MTLVNVKSGPWALASRKYISLAIFDVLCMCSVQNRDLQHDKDIVKTQESLSLLGSLPVKTGDNLICNYGRLWQIMDHSRLKLHMGYMPKHSFI